ncbi:MAG: hypothetical protein IJ112_09190 [Oscillospiraceae bacterium]|nr:hypothetical protein [Oscillospiraceae bacterium]
MTDDLGALQLAWDRKHLCRVQLDHASFLILAQNGDEVQEPFDVLVSVFRCAACGGFANEIVCKLIVDNQRAGGIKVKEIGAFLAIALAVFTLKRIRILRTERRLHVAGRALHVTEHEHAAPFRDRHAHSELSNSQRNGFVVRCDGSLDFIIGFLCFFLIGQTPVTRCQNDFIFVKQT